MAFNEPTNHDDKLNTTFCEFLEIGALGDIAPFLGYKKKIADRIGKMFENMGRIFGLRIGIRIPHSLIRREDSFWGGIQIIHKMKTLGVVSGWYRIPSLYHDEPRPIRYRVPICHTDQNKNEKIKECGGVKISRESL